MHRGGKVSTLKMRKDVVTDNWQSIDVQSLGKNYVTRAPKKQVGQFFNVTCRNIGVTQNLKVEQKLSAF